MIPLNKNNYFFKLVNKVIFCGKIEFYLILEDILIELVNIQYVCVTSNYLFSKVQWQSLTIDLVNMQAIFLMK